MSGFVNGTCVLRQYQIGAGFRLIVSLSRHTCTFTIQQKEELSKKYYFPYVQIDMSMSYISEEYALLRITIFPCSFAE